MQWLKVGENLALWEKIIAVLCFIALLMYTVPFLLIVFGVI